MKRDKPQRSIPPPALARRRIFILDDHPITRYGLTQLLNREPDLVACGEAEDARQALAAIKPPLPHLVVADVGLPGKSIIEFIKDLRVLCPSVPVLILSTHDENIYAERLVRAGARGYIMKNEGGANLLKAIRKVLQGHPYLSPAMATKVLEAFGSCRERTGTTELGKLTDREFEILRYLGEGLTTREISQSLHLSPKTVETHRSHIKEKLGIRSLPELMKYAVRWAVTQGLI